MQFGSDWEFIEVSDGSGGVNLRIRHIPSGETFTMQSDGTTATRALDTDAVRIGLGHQHAKPEDGTDGIQAAVDALPSSGGLVTLSSGTYEASSGHQYPDSLVKVKKDNVAIVGQGRATEIFVPADYQDDDGQGMRILDFGGNTNDPWVSDSNLYLHGCGVANLLINGNQQNNNGVGDGDTLTNADDGHNLEMYGTGHHVHNVWSINATGDGVEFTSQEPDTTKSNWNIVSGSTFKDCWEQCVHVHASGNTLVVGNTLDGEYNKGVLNLSAGDDNFSNTIITSNVIRNGDNVGAHLHAGPNDTAVVDHVLFANNIVADNAEAGVVVRGISGVDIHIKNNLIFDNSTHGVYVFGDAERVHVKDNEIATNGKTGVRLDQGIDGSTTGTLKKLYVKDNFIYNNNDGANSAPQLLIVSEGNALENVHVKDNEFLWDSNATATTNQIETQENAAGSYSDLIIENNNFKGTAPNRVIISPNIPLTVRDNDGFPSEFTTTKSFSGDGSATSFTTPHGVRALDGGFPTNAGDLDVQVTPVNSVAQNAVVKQSYPTDADSDGDYQNFTVEFETAPVSGTNNVDIRATIINQNLEG